MNGMQNPEPLSETELIGWIRSHSALETLCDAGGWPDIEHAEIEVCSRNDDEWIVMISATESVMEISECDVAEYSRCGKFSVRLDEAGQPVEIRLLYPM